MSDGTKALLVIFVLIPLLIVVFAEIIHANYGFIVDFLKNLSPN